MSRADSPLAIAMPPVSRTGGHYHRKRGREKPGILRPVRRLRRAVPGVIVIAMGLGEAVLEEGVVVVLLDVMDLQPDARRMDGLDMGGKAAVRFVDVGADVARAVDHVLRIDAGVLEV